MGIVGRLSGSPSFETVTNCNRLEIVWVFKERGVVERTTVLAPSSGILSPPKTLMVDPMRMTVLSATAMLSMLLRTGTGGDNIRQGLFRNVESADDVDGRLHAGDRVLGPGDVLDAVGDGEGRREHPTGFIPQC